MNLKFIKYKHYFEAYRRELDGISVNHLLEIGVQCGGSLQYWKKEYPTSTIYGIDIDPACKNVEQYTNCTVFIGDQSSKRFLREVISKTRKLDVIIDDGGHRPFMQRRSFEVLWHHLNVGGVYIIEDITTLSQFKFLNELVNGQSVYKTDVAKIVHYPQIIFIYKGQIHNPIIEEYGEVDCRGDKGIKGSTALAMFKFWVKNHLLRKVI